MSAATEHPVFKDNVAVEKSAARVYLGIKFPNADALRALDMSQTGIVWVGTGQFYRDASDTTSADDGITVIVDAAGNRWKAITGSGGVQIDAAGLLADRDDFDEEDSPFVYYATDTELAYAKNSAVSADWSTGFTIVGAPGAAATVAVGTVDTVTPSTPASVTNVGTSNAAVLDFEIPKGEPGDNGLDGTTSGLPFTFRTKTAVEEPDNLGDFNLDSGTLGSVTKLVISKYTASAGNPDTLGGIPRWWAGGSTSDRARLLIKSRADEADFIEGTISGDGIFHDDATDWYEIPFTNVTGPGIPAGTLCSIEVTPSGPEGVITGGVDSFNGRSGAVVPEAGDYDASDVDFDNSASGLAATNVQDAIDETEDRIDDIEADLTGSTNDRVLAWVAGALSFVQVTFAMIASAAIASASEVRSKAASKLVPADQMFAPLAPQALSIATGNVAVNLANGRKYTLAFSAAAQLQLPTNCAVGDDYELLITAGSGTPAWTWQSGHIGDDFTSGSLPTVNNADTKRTRILCTVLAVSGSTATSVQVLLIAAEA